tara:strand:- start:2385 stop:4058 length:1674 start_codon:yes stop_codon:yes gene_type:complete
VDSENTPDAPVKNVKVKKFDLDEGYVDSALEQVKDMISGNRIDIEEIEVKSCEGEIIHFIAETSINMGTKLTKKTMPGRVQGPVQVASDQDCQVEVDKAYLTLFDDKNIQKSIRDSILKRNDKGFAQDKLVFPYTEWQKQFVIFEPCGTCKTTGHVQCQHCAGKGIDHCPKCHGTGMVHCTHCHGSQMIQGPQGNKIQCTICHGRGKMSCNHCAQSGRIQCKTCGGGGKTKCPVCRGHAYASHITIVDLEGRCAFHYPDDELPDKVVAMIQKYGEKIKEHANIDIIQDEIKVTDESGEEERDAKHKILRIPIFYNVVLPYGHIEFDIKDKSYYTFLFGKQAMLSHVSPFMDDILQNGVRKLGDAAENRGQPEDNLKQAAQYKTLRHAMVFTANMPLRKALKHMQKRYPFGFKDNSLKSILLKIQKSYQNITKKSVITGTATAWVISTLLSLGYFASPLRPMIMTKIPSMEIGALIDALVLGVLILIGNSIIQSFAANSLMKTLKTIMPKQKFKSISAHPGKATLVNAGLSALTFLIIIEATRHLGLSTPEWYLNLIP